LALERDRKKLCDCLIYANKSTEDILLKERLSSLEAKGVISKIVYLLSRPKEETYEPKGRISEELLREYLPGVGDGVVILVCGPDGFMESAKKLLAKLGYKKEHVFWFEEPKGNKQFDSHLI